MLLDEEIWLWRTLSVPAELIEAFLHSRPSSLYRLHATVRSQGAKASGACPFYLHLGVRVTILTETGDALARLVTGRGAKSSAVRGVRALPSIMPVRAE